MVKGSKQKKYRSKNRNYLKLLKDNITDSNNRNCAHSNNDNNDSTANVTSLLEKLRQASLNNKISSLVNNNDNNATLTNLSPAFYYYYLAQKQFETNDQIISANRIN